MRWRPVAYTALGLASLLVLGATAYGWTQLSRLTGGTATTDVIEPAARPPVATSASAPVAEQNILLVGLDSRTDVRGDPLPQSLLDQLHAGDSSDGGDTTDTMIVVHIPASPQAPLTAISLPRDSYVEIAGGYGKHKINAAYSYGKQAELAELNARGVRGATAEQQADAAGARLAIRTVEQFTGLTINHYVAVNLAGFSTLSLAVGGVPVCLKAPVQDSYSGADFPAGWQTLSGARALAFVRQRHGLPNGDLDRIGRQQAFLSSMAKVVLGAGTLADPAKLTALIGAVQQSVEIDKGWDLLTFATQLIGPASGALTFTTIPVRSLTLQTPSDGDAVKVDPVAVRSFISSLLGKGPATPTAPPATVARQAAEGRPAPTTTESSVPAGSTDLTGCVN
ncbi:MAG TPA: LCP family protein [Amycolatopsis sp.]|uniref:LCP family protein n=1 Tax=Amycolatopsis sp. TaxID=37632 RepID=UPI002B480B91|nr:LCP family protein [Amycolatopsis sp.]HKS44533.1 LCP family protein [Amycolatopsis sp.]